VTRFYRNALTGITVVVVLTVVIFNSARYGPVEVTIKTNDGMIYDDFVLNYGAASYRMEGSDTKYVKMLMVDNKNTIRIEEKIISFLPSFFFVNVCHPMYRCASKHVQRKDAGKVIDFKELPMRSWKSELERDSDNFIYMQTDYIQMINDIKRNYMPHIEQDNKSNRRVYAEHLYELCMMVYKSKPELASQSCSLDNFKEMMNAHD
jgi:hypothetical protein